MVRYYGYYNNVSRGKCQKTGDDGAVFYILELPLSDKTFRKNWARMIRNFKKSFGPMCRGLPENRRK
jgi:hypothetical protein